MPHSYGWKGRFMRNVDGRTGVVSREYGDFMGVQLFIHVDGQPDEPGARDMLSLNGRDSDSGATGWYWYCEDCADGPSWLLLGDHNQGLPRIEAWPAPADLDERDRSMVQR